MNEIDLAWAAGLFEGEGTFHFVKGVGTDVAIQMTDEDVLLKMQNLFGGRVSVAYESKGNWKTCYRWTLGIKDDCEDFVRSIYPYLMSRRKEKADEWINSRREVKSRKEFLENRKKGILEALQMGKTQREVAEEFEITQAYVSIVLKRSR
ncbi:HNH endonuclease [Streptomyces phage Coruscant]|jgi:hypothetical protein|uniref:HNH endonuclease n=1 Tax=Streptomyces phage Coruscant TaxID=2739834 RepID=A0A7G4AW57_9CAUD|nr:HNH endonuclease [Streptomyces phage Coruscant]QMP84247.1 HNH endonuclease [Streptomyces phage Coruscant]